jgi:hypothetical protein
MQIDPALLTDLKTLMDGRKSFVKMELALAKYPVLHAELTNLVNLENKSLQEIIWILLHGYPESCHRGKLPAFISYNKGYGKVCGHYCPCQTEQVMALKANKTAEERAITQDRRRQTTFKKYGVYHAASAPAVQKAKIATCIRKYGTPHPQSTQDVRRRTEETNMVRYGVTTVLSGKSTVRTDINLKLKESSGVRLAKAKTTLAAKYGVNNPSQIPNISEKKKHTYFKNYGADHYMQSDTGKVEHMASVKEKYGDHISNVKQIHLSDDVLQCLHNKELFSKIAIGKSLSEIAQMLGINETTAGKKVIEFGLQSDIVYRPIVSSGHREISEWLTSIGIDHVNNDRTLIAPYELDIYIPKYNLAIEYCGIYFHSELSGNKDKKYHMTKYINAHANNITLLTIFDHEWINKQNIVKNIILNKLHANVVKMAGRKLRVTKLSQTEATTFCDNHHIQGHLHGESYGLIDKLGNIYAVMVFGKNRFSTNKQWEIYRFCTTGTVHGAMSKLLRAFCKIHKPESITTYVDHRYGTGDSYAKLGFIKCDTTIGFQYVDKHGGLHNRMKFQKHKLIKNNPNIDKTLTEWQLMQQQGYDRIWDAGQTRLILEPPNIDLYNN